MSSATCRCRKPEPSCCSRCSPNATSVARPSSPATCPSIDRHGPRRVTDASCRFSVALVPALAIIVSPHRCGRVAQWQCPRPLTATVPVRFRPLPPWLAHHDGGVGDYVRGHHGACGELLVAGQLGHGGGAVSLSRSDRSWIDRLPLSGSSSSRRGC